jgi:prepilin-type N-terminal cleavage/methylation domain-containing protein
MIGSTACFRLSSRPGMTLIELMAGVAITGMMLAGGYAAFGSVIDQRQRADDATAEAARASAVRHTLTAWLAGARVTPDEDGPGFRGVDGVHGTMPDAELRFLTTARTAASAGYTVVRLFIDRDDDTPERGLVAELMEWRGPARERIELEPRADGLEIRYLSGVRGPREWLPSWVSASVMPAAVELRLSAAADSLPPLLRLPILVSYGPSP